MTWNQQKKKTQEEIKAFFKGKDLPSLNEIQKKEVLKATEKFRAGELEKPVEERKFYVDDLGGTIYVVQFPKRSFVGFNICDEPKLSANNNWYWRGIRLPLLLDLFGDGKMPYAKTFLPEHWQPELMWEPEDEDIYIILRGNMEIKYTWLTDAKGVYGRSKNKFLNEARKRWENDSIESIDDILTNLQYKSSMGRLDITLNPYEKLGDF